MMHSTKPQIKPSKHGLVAEIDLTFDPKKPEPYQSAYLASMFADLGLPAGIWGHISLSVVDPLNGTIRVSLAVGNVSPCD